MADNRNNIDELSIDIKVVENGVARRINAITQSISNLTKSIQSFDRVSKALAKIKNVSKPQKDLSGILKKTTDNPLKMASGESLGERQFYTYDKTLEKLKKFGSNSKKALKDTNKEAKKTVGIFDKLGRSIIRVGFYRLVRTALSTTVKSFQGGIENIRSVDKQLDTSLNRISASATSLKNSLGSLVTPLIKAVEPIITRLSDGIAGIVNRITEAQAAMAGQSTYTKILTSDTEEYQKALEKTNGTLLAFDTFTTLASKNTYTGTKEENVVMSKEEGEQISNRYQTILQTITAIGVALATWKIVGFLKDVAKLKNILGAVNGTLGIAGAVVGIFNVISGIKDIMNWDETTSSLQRVADVARVVFGIVAAIAGVMAIMKGGTIAGMILGAISVTAAIGAMVASIGSHAEQLKGYANGGIYESGDYFKANENGRTELIASTNGGGGSVMNLSQWQQVSEIAFYNALTRYNAKQNGNDGQLDMNSLGRAVAGNVGFRNEINRRNASLNLK